MFHKSYPNKMQLVVGLYLCCAVRVHMWLIFNHVCNNILHVMCFKLHFIIQALCLMQICACVYIYIFFHSKIMMVHLFEHLSRLCCIYIGLFFFFLKVILCM
jgi:hypothetical protein